MQTVNFFGKDLSRLIVGDNPFTGHSYTDLLTERELLSYHTEENIIASLQEAERCGYNAMLPLGDPFILRSLYHFEERGGNMTYILQFFPSMDIRADLRIFKQLNGAFAVYHQGTTTDNLYENGKVDQIKENLKILRASGLKVGLGTHRPDVIELCESEGWDVDFYVACLQNARRGREREESGFITGKTKQGLLFYPEDRPIMLDLISRVTKPCIAYKIFAGGQMFQGHTDEEVADLIRGVYREVFTKIKPTDLACIGVYQGKKNQLKQDADLFAEVMETL